METETATQIAQTAGPSSRVAASAPKYEDVMLAGTSAPSRVAAPVPQYEDMMPARKVAKSSDSYQITQCSAYGVSVKT